MDNPNRLFVEDYCPIKTARQKKRLLKKDRGKQLIQLDKRRQDLAVKRYNLPLVPLEMPYQKGFERRFVLRDDVARSRHALFYQNLLDKINTVQYHHDKHFSTSKKKRRKRIQVSRLQTLKEYDEQEWRSKHNKLTEAERLLFYPRETYCVARKRKEIRYVFAEHWRYRLQVRPFMITHRKMIDEALEQEIQEIDNYIEKRNLQPAMDKARRGSRYNPRCNGAYLDRHNPEVFKQPLYRILNACRESDNEIL